MKLVRRYRQQQQVPGSRCLAADPAKITRQGSLKLGAMVAPQPIVVSSGLNRQLISNDAEPNAIEPVQRVPPLRPIGSADQQSGPFGVHYSHRSGSRVAGQQVIAWQVGLAAEVDGIVEPLRAGRQPLVAALGKLDHGTGGHVSRRCASQ